MVDEDAIYAEIESRTQTGLQRDDVPGFDPAVRGGLRRLYHRGCADFDRALEAGWLEPLPRTPPATEQAVARVEDVLKTPLPGLLKRLYLRVANGGFGPAYGVLGIDGGFPDDLKRTAVDILLEHDRGLWPGMPDGLLPVCHWGCAIYSFVHCPSGLMFGWDPNPVEPEDDVPFFEQEYTLASWLAAWLDGSLRQPCLVVDPRTGEYRGATIAETAAVDEED